MADKVLPRLIGVNRAGQPVKWIGRNGAGFNRPGEHLLCNPSSSAHRVIGKIGAASLLLAVLAFAFLALSDVTLNRQPFSPFLCVSCRNRRQFPIWTEELHKARFHLPELCRRRFLDRSLGVYVRLAVGFQRTDLRLRLLLGALRWFNQAA
ncbi:MAG: hypothetical protein NXI32_17895 [bacterium]|nr:hypothetical protein [bacterium]